MPPTNNSRSNLQLLRYLPSDIVIDILSRLPIRTIVICKSVCRAWRDLLRTREFADFHLSRSVPGLVIGEGLYDYGPKALEIYEFDDELGLEHHNLHYKLLIKIDSVEFLIKSELHGSANGLVLLHRELPGKCDALYVCNPITREYIELLYDRLVSVSPSTAIFTYGFGVSKITGQYKVVRILHECNNGHDSTLPNVTMSICHVYTLGTGIWRSITFPASFRSADRSIGVCLNGNLHWLVQVLDGSHCIFCFDLETETFSTWCLPSPLSERVCVGPVVGLVVLGDCLCVSDDKCADEVVCWLMKEYGDEKSWNKEFVIRISIVDVGVGSVECTTIMNPIKVFKDGDILMAFENMFMFYYSNKTKTIEQCEVFGSNQRFEIPAMKAMLHTSSFIPLGSFGNERVSRC